MEQKLTYTEAMKQLEEIVGQLEDNTLDIDLLAEKVKTAQELIKFCRDKLYKTDEEIQKLLASKE
ncbi:MAG: exodeoxyribonuclease VII small subunit [Bacteroidaceae bacterium]|jgi:exodeoxyribonuclease VII small subunit|nr:exodeoxyribonuclease VII small subunit [Bacteroidaceae bacterium]MBR6988921.1 exodeoxyribonuclease VII small subunit [Bacteroidaceae bacterium]